MFDQLCFYLISNIRKNYEIMKDSLLGIKTNDLLLFVTYGYAFP